MKFLSALVNINIETGILIQHKILWKNPGEKSILANKGSMESNDVDTHFVIHLKGMIILIIIFNF